MWGTLICNLGCLSFFLSCLYDVRNARNIKKMYEIIGNVKSGCKIPVVFFITYFCYLSSGINGTISIRDFYLINMLNLKYAF